MWNVHFQSFESFELLYLIYFTKILKVEWNSKWTIETDLTLNCTVPFNTIPFHGFFLSSRSFFMMCMYSALFMYQDKRQIVPRDNEEMKIKPERAIYSSSHSVTVWPPTDTQPQEVVRWARRGRERANEARCQARNTVPRKALKYRTRLYVNIAQDCE